ncbi:phosphoribosyltransferase family protein [Vulcanisaeta distributa]|uniref:Phosphoribosyltransferase n=1 Tax=Vulcanisaeta distributa (strain DSM 14429 / JCM 11212 / NBRC 100878 / IC-017) TaxID=572478 RepID=E1QNP0_VULDI|nr:phosphoribosyltransferase family protein [Vulcanisaeta distributa]ADN51328.1 phosphoribosyltransferase [Vulcanisaeta distributa DSM 14429]
MRAGRRLAKVDEQLEAVELINSAKSIYNLSYRELSQVLNIPESLLCRYANGDLLPSLDTVNIIKERLRPMLDLTEVLRRNVIIKDGFIDLNNVLFNPYILKLYQRRVKDVFSDLPINKVLTAATDGIPLSVMASYALNARLAIAKQYKDVASEDFYEVSYIVDSPPRRVSLYLPRHLLERGDEVLIVDDIVRTGRTLNALIELVNNAGARLVGVSVLISMSKAWIDKLRNKDIRVDVILDLSDLRS